MSRVKGFFRLDEATTVPEHTLMLALIVLTALGAISGIGVAVSNAYASLDNSVSGVG